MATTASIPSGEKPAKIPTPASAIPKQSFGTGPSTGNSAPKGFTNPGVIPGKV